MSQIFDRNAEFDHARADLVRLTMPGAGKNRDWRQGRLRPRQSVSHGGELCRRAPSF
jgi:hypothetical protein